MLRPNDFIDGETPSLSAVKKTPKKMNILHAVFTVRK